MSNTDPAAIAYADQMDAMARDLWPNKSPEWRRVWFSRLAHHALHDRSLPDAPEFPDSPGDEDA